MIKIENNKINGLHTMEQADKLFQSYSDILIELFLSARDSHDMESSYLLYKQAQQWGWQMDLLYRVKEVSGVLQFKNKTEYLEELKRLHKALDEYPRDSQCVLDEVTFMNMIHCEEYEDEDYKNFTTLNDEYNFS